MPESIDADGDERVQSSGTKVLLDGQEIAYCCDAGVAEVIKIAMTYAGMESSKIPQRERQKLTDFFA